jgi:hypothetical protein
MDMNEIIFYQVPRDLLCETNYLDDIINVLNNRISNYSIIVTNNGHELPITRFKKIVLLIGEEVLPAGAIPYKSYTDIIKVFRFFNIEGRYNKNPLPLPVGYNCKSNGQTMIRMYPEKRLQERRYDIFYAGHVGLLECRIELINKLASLTDLFKIFYQANSKFREGLPIDDYYRLLGDSKICVVPDGSSIHTYRFAEACGSGCVIITTHKSDLWYYRDAPLFYIDNWRRLTKEFLDNILNSDLDVLQDEIKKYYDEYLSGSAVADFIIKNI